jgi:DNA-binding NtrC family response regulator
MAAMQRYPWPGNIRELENCLERAVVLNRTGRVELADLPPAVREGRAASLGGAPLQVNLPGAGCSLEAALAGPEKQIILAALGMHHHSRQRTADALGIDRTTLYKKMRKHGLLGGPKTQCRKE